MVLELGGDEVRKVAERLGCVEDLYQMCQLWRFFFKKKIGA